MEGLKFGWINSVESRLPTLSHLPAHSGATFNSLELGLLDLALNVRDAVHRSYPFSTGCVTAAELLHWLGDSREPRLDSSRSSAVGGERSALRFGTRWKSQCRTIKVSKRTELEMKTKSTLFDWRSLAGSFGWLAGSQAGSLRL